MQFNFLMFFGYNAIAFIVIFQEVKLCVWNSNKASHYPPTSGTHLKPMIFNLCAAEVLASYNPSSNKGHET